MFKLVKFSFLTAIFGIAMMSCKGDEEVILPNDVVYSPQPPYTVEVGKTLTVTGTVTPDNITDKEFTIASGNTAIATVTGSVKSGKVEATATGVSPGKTNITITHVKSGFFKVGRFDGDYDFGCPDRNRVGHVHVHRRAHYACNRNCETG